MGLGYDVHRFDPERPLILGGVEIAFHHGLAGHSDADVLSHALGDALLGKTCHKLNNSSRMTAPKTIFLLIISIDSNSKAET